MSRPKEGEWYVNIGDERYGIGRKAVVLEINPDYILMGYPRPIEKRPNREHFRRPIKGTDYFTGDMIRVTEDFGAWKAGDEGMLPQMDYFVKTSIPEVPDYLTEPGGPAVVTPEGKRLSYRFFEDAHPWRILPGNRVTSGDSLPVQYVELHEDEGTKRAEYLRDQMFSWLWKTSEFDQVGYSPYDFNHYFRSFTPNAMRAIWRGDYV